MHATWLSPLLVESIWGLKRYANPERFSIVESNGPVRFIFGTT